MCGKEYKFSSKFCDHMIEKHKEWVEKTGFNINDLWVKPVYIGGKEE